MLDGKRGRIVSEVVEQLRTLFGARLITVALYGSAVGPDFVPGVSDINLVVVLDAVTFTDLDTLRLKVPRWRKRGLATPLVLDRAFLRNAADVFPMEIEDIKEHHRVLDGEDALAALPVRRDHLRYQCEHEARGKLLRLQELYLEHGENSRALRALMLESLKTFLIVMRNVNRICGVHEPGSYQSVLRAFTRHQHCELPVMSHLLRIKLAQEKWRDDTAPTFRAYLEEVRQLVRCIDQLPAGALRCAHWDTKQPGPLRPCACWP